MRGIGAEYFANGVNPTHSHERFYEAHELILRAWTETGPFRYHGRHYQFDYVNLWPRPLQQPHPPVWIPSQGSSETVRMVRVGQAQVHLPADLQPGEVGEEGVRSLSRRWPRTRGL